MKPFEYYKPQTGGELLSILQKTGGKVLAGGTDIIPRLRRGRLNAEHLVDIGGLGLNFIREVGDRIEIGSFVTHSDLIHSTLIRETAPSLVHAASSVGCTQTRQRGTIGGNLVNASPAADLAPALLVLDASVHLISPKAKRTVPLASFWTDPGKTILLPHEYLEKVSFDKPVENWGSAFAKLGKRKGMAIAVASVAAYLELDHQGKIKIVRVALGSLAPKTIRAASVEKTLMNKTVDSGLISDAAKAALHDISPISDVRASRAYRIQSCPVLVHRVLVEAHQQAIRRTQ